MADMRIPLYLHLPDELTCVFQNQDVDLVAMLRAEGFDVERGAVDPTQRAGTKDAALVIIASGAAAYMVGLAIVRIIKTVRGGPVVGTLGPLLPVVDSSGQIVRDKNNQPLTYRVGEKQILDPDAQTRDAETHISIPSILEIEVK